MAGRGWWCVGCGEWLVVCGQRVSFCKPLKLIGEWLVGCGQRVSFCKPLKLIRCPQPTHHQPLHANQINFAKLRLICNFAAQKNYHEDYTSHYLHPQPHNRIMQPRTAATADTDGDKPTRTRRRRRRARQPHAPRHSDRRRHVAHTPYGKYPRRRRRWQCRSSPKQHTHSDCRN